MSTQLPRITGPVPGPKSRELAVELRRWESPNITYVDDRFPIFWSSASGAMVEDVDGNIYLDMTAAFGAAAVGHCNPRVVEAIQHQARVLIHGMGDVHPSVLKVELARRLATLAPGDLQQTIFGCSGSDAVEAALKTARMATGKPGVVAFHGAYHGLSYGALNVTSRNDFRGPFLDQIGNFGVHIPYPYCYRCPWDKSYPSCGMSCLETVDAALAEPNIGAIIVEPIQGRGGIIEPPAGWFAGVRQLATHHKVLLIADEVFTGFGRTGPLFASEEPPDLMCVGKALGGGMPVSACIGTPDVMAAWGESAGEAIHTSTFLGHPAGCAAALAVLDALESGNLLAQCHTAGQLLLSGLKQIQGRRSMIGDVRGRGLMLGVEIVRSNGEPHGEAAGETMIQALKLGLILLPAGEHGNVLELTPPFVIDDQQTSFALNTLEAALELASKSFPP